MTMTPIPSVSLISQPYYKLRVSRLLPNTHGSIKFRFRKHRRPPDLQPSSYYQEDSLPTLSPMSVNGATNTATFFTLSVPWSTSSRLPKWKMSISTPSFTSWWLRTNTSFPPLRTCPIASSMSVARRTSSSKICSSLSQILSPNLWKGGTKCRWKRIWKQQHNFDGSRMALVEESAHHQMVSVTRQ